MRSQGCPGCQNFLNFVLKTNLLFCSTKIQLKLSKLPKYGQKQRFFRSFFAFFAFFQFWLNISASNCQNLIWHEIFDLLTPWHPWGRVCSAWNENWLHLTLWLWNGHSLTSALVNSPSLKILSFGYFCFARISTDRKRKFMAVYNAEMTFSAL